MQERLCRGSVMSSMLVLCLCLRQFVTERAGVRGRECIVNVAVVADWTTTSGVGIGGVTGVIFV